MLVCAGTCWQGFEDASDCARGCLRLTCRRLLEVDRQREGLSHLSTLLSKERAHAMQGLPGISNHMLCRNAVLVSCHVTQKLPGMWLS